MMKKIENYIESHTTPESPILAELFRETHLKAMYPRMLSGHYQGKLLEIISYMVKPSRILEIGTFTGYASICLARGLKKGGTLVTIELNPELSEISDKYFKKTGLEKTIITHIGNALDIIPRLKEDFDMVFIDADKENYLNYYQLVFDKIKPGGFILADNALWSGKVLKKNTSDKETKGISEFNDFVHQDPRVDNILIPVRDGIMILRKK